MRGWTRAVDYVRRFARFALPEPEDSAPRLRQQLPRSTLHWASAVVLVVAVGVFAGFWAEYHSNYLLDPGYQTDDARTMIFPFHRYGPEGALADDPIANDMIAFAPAGWWFLYRLLVPTVGLLAATKVVQVLCLAILLWACYLLLRSPRAGLASALLLLFLFLHTQYIVGRIGGGLPRGFAFPLFALWGAGAITGALRVRFVAAVLGALIYPTTTVMVLAAEGILAVLPRRASPLWRRLARYGVMAGTCVALMLPFLFKGDVGTVHTLEQAQQEPAFRDRLAVLPFPDPVKEFARHFVTPFNDREGRRTDIGRAYKKHESTGALIFVAVLLLVPFLGFCPAPRSAVAFFCGALFCYLFARIMAFILYSPERYYSFGMPMACILLSVATIGLLWTERLRWWSAPARNSVAVVFIGLLLLLTGDGMRRDNMMVIKRSSFAPLYDYIGKLPLSTRIAAHPYDGEGIPLWAARATTGGYETLQPWLVKPWRRGKQRTEKLLAALYATDKAPIDTFCDRYKVSHFLVNVRRYRADYRRQAKVFEPFGAYLRNLLRRRQVKDMLLAKIKEKDPAVVFSYRGLLLVDAKRLRGE